MGAFVQVDRSTNVGELLYTIENQNDPVNINMTTVSPYVELNPSNDRKYDAFLLYYCYSSTITSPQKISALSSGGEIPDRESLTYINLKG